MHLRLPWPLPALSTWAAAWALYAALRSNRPLAYALAVGMALALALALGSTRWRRIFIALGFPLSAAATGNAIDLPAWQWLVPLALLGTLYPLNAWRDAPLFPTPAGALDRLAGAAPLAAGARVLDAGCGVGDGLIALRRAYPAARLEGLEWSWPLALAARLRCRAYASVKRGDLWKVDWAGFDLVYLFQRPESMPRAWAKACREMRPGGWLVSLEFDIADAKPVARIEGVGQRTVWVYRTASRSA